jgi:hypothetical protein
VYFDRDANYFSTEAICFFVQWMHSSFFYRRQRSKPRVSNLGFCKETFVIFASFCSNFFERLFTEGNEGNKRFDLFGSPSLSSFPSVYVFFLLAALLRIGLDD